MYRICVVWFIVCLMYANSTSAQRALQPAPGNIKPFRLAISTNKTTNLIFPYVIKSVDRGTSDILVQKAKGVDNILLVKADTANFPETNLSVVTSDSKFYSFLVSYSQSPRFLNLVFEKQAVAGNTPAILTNRLLDQAGYEQVLEWVSAQPPFLRKQRRSNRLRIKLRGIYIKDSVLVFGMQLKNDAQFPYSPAAIRFVIKNNKQAKRSVVQEISLDPLYEPEFLPIRGHQDTTIAIGFTPFTFSENQQLFIQVEEKNGGRSVNLPISLKTLLKARAIK